MAVSQRGIYLVKIVTECYNETMADYRLAIDSLQNEPDYRYLIVYYNLNFVDPDSGAHT